MKNILTYNNFINEEIGHLERHYFQNSYVSKIANKLGYELLYFIDSGTQGVAYRLEGNKVMKITTDKNEFMVANKLKKKPLKRISDVYETFRIKGYDIYIIILEYLEPLSDEVSDLLSDYFEMYFTNMLNNDSKFEWLKQQLLEIEKEFNANGILNPYDYDWYLNMGFKNGELAAFDVGDKTIDYSEYPEIEEIK